MPPSDLSSAQSQSVTVCSPPSLRGGVASSPAELSLQRNFSWAFVGNVVFAGSQWGALVAIARLGSPEMVGQLALSLAITAPVILFTNLQLRTVQATDAKNAYSFRDYLALRLISTTVALVVIVCLGAMSGNNREATLVILTIGMAKAFEAVSDVFYGLLQKQERMDLIAKSMILRGTAALVSLCIGVHLTGRLIWGAVGMAFVWGASLICYDVPTTRRVLESIDTRLRQRAYEASTPSLRLRWNAKVLSELTRVALPLGLVTMLVSFNTNIPRYFIVHHLGAHQLGIFAAIAHFAVAGNLVINALGQTASPRLAKFYASGNRSGFLVLLLRLVAIGLLLSLAAILVAIFFGRQFLTLAFGAKYAREDLFVALTVGAGIGYVASLLGYGMTAARYFRAPAPMLAVVAGVTAGTCLLLIPARGLSGVTTAIIVAALLQLVISIAIVSHSIFALRSNAESQQKRDVLNEWSR